MSENAYPGEEYFDLVVECAKKYYDTRPPSVHPLEFWRNSVRKEWQSVYSHMTRPVDGGVMHLADARRRQLASNFAALSRMAAMAAWWIGIQREDGEDNPDIVAERFIEMGTQQAPKLR